MTGDWSYWLREHRGTLLAFAAFIVMFTIYVANHPAGLNVFLHFRLRSRS